MSVLSVFASVCVCDWGTSSSWYQQHHQHVRTPVETICITLHSYQCCAVVLLLTCCRTRLAWYTVCSLCQHHSRMYYICLYIYGMHVYSTCKCECVLYPSMLLCVCGGELVKTVRCLVFLCCEAHTLSAPTDANALLLPPLHPFAMPPSPLYTATVVITSIGEAAAAVRLCCRHRVVAVVARERDLCTRRKPYKAARSY